MVRWSWWYARVGVLLLSSCVTPGVADAQSAENVAVVINENSAASKRIGETYAKRRALPSTNVVRIRTSEKETLDRATYESSVEAPIAAHLTREGLQDRVLYLVLTKGVPLRVTGTDDIRGTAASVDSELTLLYRKLTAKAVPLGGQIDNPYFLKDAPVPSARQFSRRAYDIFLVSRLDAFTVEEALGLIDKALTAESVGKIVLDQQDKLVNRQGEDWLDEAATRLNAAGQADRVLLDRTVRGVRNVAPVIGYYSWGSNDPRNRVRSLGMGFTPGALAATFVSTDARTFEVPPESWVPSDSSEKSKWFNGSPQSLIGDLVREGVTGAAGHVAEPYLASTIRPQILFPAYLAGFNLVESFYLAMPYLSWRTLVIGDPLCAPFRKSQVPRSDIEGPTDGDTTLPGFFAARRVASAVAAAPSVPESALRLRIRADALLARGNSTAARLALEQATSVAPLYTDGHMALALLLDANGQREAANERYRRVIELEPRHVVALNNLAYRMALEGRDLKEALALAERAATVAPQATFVLDTLAWAQYLTGDLARAATTMAKVLRQSALSAEVRLHAAVIYAANGTRAVAQDQLKEALRLEPSLESSEDVKRVRSLLEKAAASR